MRFRRTLREVLAADRPDNVDPIDEWLAEPRFFPGASGLPTESTWATLRRGARPPLGDDVSHYPEVGARDVMIVGNYLASRASYKNVLRDPTAGFDRTWDGLAKILDGIDPRRCFLTNLYVGLPNHKGDTKRFPSTPEFTHKCVELLRIQIDELKPRVIVCLGARVGQAFPSVVDRDGPIPAWKPWRKFDTLRAEQSEVVRGCRFGDHEAAAVVIPHPSSSTTDQERRRGGDMIRELLTR